MESLTTLRSDKIDRCGGLLSMKLQGDFEDRLRQRERVSRKCIRKDNRRSGGTERILQVSKHAIGCVSRVSGAQLTQLLSPKIRFDEENDNFRMFGTQRVEKRVDRAFDCGFN